jgi:hypothetical protein
LVFGWVLVKPLKHDRDCRRPVKRVKYQCANIPSHTAGAAQNFDRAPAVAGFMACSGATDEGTLRVSGSAATERG